MRKFCAKTVAAFVLVCLMAVPMAAPAYAAGSDLERMAQTDQIIVVGTYVYGDAAYTFAAGEPVYSYDVAEISAEARAGVSYPIYLYDQSGNLLLVQHVSFTINGSAGNDSFAETRKWNWYTTDLADGLLLGGAKNTRLSNTKAEHAFTWYYGGDTYRTTAAFTLNRSTGSVVLSNLQNSVNA